MIRYISRILILIIIYLFIRNFYPYKLIEKCGDVEIELEKILEHSNKLHNYIHNNLFLQKNIDDILVNISQIKKTKETLKQGFMINGLKCIKIGLKKKSINETKDHLKNLNSLKEIIDLLKVLSTNPSKFELVNELLAKGKNLINSFPSDIREKTLLVKKFEEEFGKYTNKSSENMIEEFQKVISSYLSDSLEIMQIINIEELDKVLYKERYIFK